MPQIISFTMNMVVPNPIVPAFTSFPLVYPGQPYSFQMTFTNGTPPYAITANSGLPAGLTCSPAGLISGTPTGAPGTSSPVFFGHDSSQ